jgi:hypothetical protein
MRLKIYSPSDRSYFIILTHPIVSLNTSIVTFSGRHNTILVLGKTYHYFDTVKTWHGERAVEIPIVIEMVRKYQGKNILEVGNVLSHHMKFEHDILDKYEIAKGVTNSDVTHFTSEKKDGRYK